MAREDKCCGVIPACGPDDNTVRRQAGYFKAMSDPARVRIIYALADGERCVCELMLCLIMSQTLVSHHLKILKNEGIISDRKAGKWVYYSLADENAIAFVKALDKK